MGAFDSALSKLDNPTLGQALGFFMTELNYDKTTGQPMLGALMQQIRGAMLQPHFPNIEHVMRDLMADAYGGTVFKGGLMAGIAGWILDEVDMNPSISRMGKVLKTLGFNAALGAAAVVLLDDSTRGYSPNGEAKGGGSSGLKSSWGGN